MQEDLSLFRRVVYYLSYVPPTHKETRCNVATETYMYIDTHISRQSYTLHLHRAYMYVNIHIKYKGYIHIYIYIYIYIYDLDKRYESVKTQACIRI